MKERKTHNKLSWENSYEVFMFLKKNFHHLCSFINYEQDVIIFEKNDKESLLLLLLASPSIIRS
jgi:hypothetical protein